MELTIIDPKEFGIEESKAKLISDQFKPMLDKMVELEVEANEVFSLDINDKESAKKAKEVRLKYVKVRTGTAEIHKAQKAFYLQAGRFVDGWKNTQLFASQGIEEKLEAIEKHIENLEKQRAKDLNDARIERIKPYVEDTTGLDFAPMSDEDFDDYLLGKKTRFENEEKEREAEALRIKQNRIDTDRRTSRELILLNIEGVKRNNNNMTYTLKCIENEDFSNVIDMSEILDCSDEQFKKYLDEFISTRDENEKFINKQKSENIRLEAELKEKQDAEIKAENARIAKEKAEKLEAEKLAKAPIKKQLSIWVDSFELPECTTYNATSKEISEKFEAFKKWSINQVNNL
jgi:hypothetical protein